MLGIVNLVDVRPATEADAAAAMCDVPAGSYAWVLANSRQVEPRKIIGKLRLFDVPDDSIRVLDDEDWVFAYPPPQGERKIGKRSTVCDLT